MRPTARSIVLCVLTSALLSGCTGKNATTDGTSGPQLKPLPNAGRNQVLRVEDRIPAPALRGETLDGEQLDVRDLRGKVVVLNFWASWCAPCRAESPNLVKVANDNADKGVAFVGVNFKDKRANARRFDEVHAVPYPSLYDQPGVILTRLRKLVPQTPPSTLLIDRSGRIAGIFRGGVTETELSGPVQALAAESA